MISELYQQIFVFTDKIINWETANQIRGVIEMTQIGQIIEEEKIAYGRKIAAEAAKNAKEDARQTAINLLKADMPAEEVARMVSNITLEEALQLKEELLQTV